MWLSATVNGQLLSSHTLLEGKKAPQAIWELVPECVQKEFTVNFIHMAVKQTGNGVCKSCGLMLWNRPVMDQDKKQFDL